MIVTGTTVAPVTFTTMLVADAAAMPLLRVKLIVPGMGPAVGVTVNEPGGTPAVETVAVNVPEPDTDAVPVWPQPTVSVVGVTAMLGATGAGAASPAGPSAPITEGDSIARFCVSVMTSVPEPQPLCVTR